MPLVLLIPLILLFSGCSKAPDLPKLGRENQSEPTRRLLSSKLEPKDYREIFQAINRDGKLDSLKTYFEKPSEENLRQIGAVISRHLYEDNEGLDILSARIKARSFSEPLGLLPHRELFRALIQQEEVRSLAGKTHAVWSRAWADTAVAIHDAAEAYSARPSSLDGPSFVKDLVRFLDSPMRPEAEKLWTDLKRDRAGTTLLGALSVLREEYGSKAFEGLGLGLSELLPKESSKPNTLHKLFELIHKADHPTEGLFEAISLKLQREPDLIHEIANRVRPLVINATTGFSKELISESKLLPFSVPKKGNELANIFICYRTALERVAGPVQEMTLEPEAFLHNLRLYMNAFALAKWTVLLAESQAPVWATIPAADFEKMFWDLPVKIPELTLDLKSPEMLAEMRAIGLDGEVDDPVEIKFVTQLEKYKDAPLGNFVYGFPEITEAVPLRTALKQTMENLSVTRPISDPTSFVRALVYPLTRPEAGGLFTFADLESKNFMVWVNEHLAAMTLGAWRKFKKTLFEDMELTQLDDPNFDTRKLVLDFYPQQPLRDRVIELLDRIPSLYEFDRERDELPTPFVAYLTLIKERPRTLPSTTHLLGFIGKARLLTEDYPFLFELVQRRLPVGRGLAALSILDPDERDTFLKPLAKVEPGPFMAIVDKLTKSHPKNLETFTQDFFDSKLWDQLPCLTDEERKWIDEFLASPDWDVSWNFFRAHATLENSRQLVTELKKLTANGYLREGAKLLYHFQNDRLHRFADVWLEWESTGQWSAFLDRAQELLSP